MHKKAIKKRTKRASVVLQQENQISILQSRRQSYTLDQESQEYSIQKETLLQVYKIIFYYKCNRDTNLSIATFKLLANCNGFAVSYIYYFLANVETRKHLASAFDAVGFDSILLHKFILSFIYCFSNSIIRISTLSSRRK